MVNEAVFRLGVFFSVLMIVVLWEWWRPKRHLSVQKPQRWFSNFGISFLNIALLRAVFPLTAAGAALWAAEHQVGLLNVLQLSGGLAWVLGFVLLDLLIYSQHWLFHHVPLLWRIHSMHHADLDIDVSTGVRFHPLEAILSMVIKISAIVLLGVPMLAVVIFEVVLNATAMFNHGNIALPARADRWLRLLVVTPDMHRVHHSIRPGETHSNFGFNLPWWDRWFGTYKAQPQDGHKGMNIGLAQTRSPSTTTPLGALLSHPFRYSENDSRENL